MLKLTVQQIMSTEVSHLDPSASLADVVAEMSSRSISCVVLCDGREPVGIISERDLTRELGRLIDGRDVPRTAAEVMTAPPITIERGATVPEAMEVLKLNSIRRLVVVHDDGSLAGLITQTDLLKSHAEAIEAARNMLEGLVVSKTTELEAANRQLETMALRDSMLGIGNRRAMEMELDKVDSVADRYGRMYSVALLDVDHFKTYNDTYGHPEGDLVLQRIAREVGRVIRTTDSLYRYGGEELLVLLPETNLVGARRAADRIRRAIEALHIPHSGAESGTVTVSIGVAEFAQRARKPGDGWNDVVRVADRSLYAAKTEGRNRVVAECTSGQLTGVG